MRKLIESTFVSMDGIISDTHPSTASRAEPQHWGRPYWDEDHKDYAAKLVDSADTLLAGRVTYEGMAEAWMSRAGDPFADQINNMPKYVASRTLTEATWNATVIKDVPEEVARLKEQPGKNILKWGTGELDRALVEHRARRRPPSGSGPRSGPWAPASRSAASAAPSCRNVSRRRAGSRPRRPAGAAIPAGQARANAGRPVRPGPDSDRRACGAALPPRLPRATGRGSTRRPTPAAGTAARRRAPPVSGPPARPAGPAPRPTGRRPPRTAPRRRPACTRRSGRPGGAAPPVRCRTAAASSSRSPRPGCAAVRARRAARRQQAEPVLGHAQPHRQLGHAQRGHPGRGQFQRQRDTVQPPAHLSHTGGGLRCRVQARPRQEHPYGGGAGQPFRVVGVGDVQRLHVPAGLAAQPQRLPAGGQHPHARRGRKQRADQPGHRQPVSIKKVFLKQVTSDVATAQLGTGEMDLAQISPTDLPAVRKLKDVKVVTAKSPGFNRIAINQTQARFKDARVRQAMLHAIDRKGLVDKVLGGAGTVVDTSFYGDLTQNAPTYGYTARWQG